MCGSFAKSTFPVAVLLAENLYVKKIATPIYVLAYILELTGLYVFLYEYFEGHQDISHGDGGEL